MWEQTHGKNVKVASRGGEQPPMKRWQGDKDLRPGAARTFILPITSELRRGP